MQVLENPSKTSQSLHLPFLKTKIGEKTASKLLALTEKQSQESQTNLFDSLAHTSVIAKVPADAKEDWSQWWKLFKMLTPTPGRTVTATSTRRHATGRRRAATMPQ